MRKFRFLRKGMGNVWDCGGDSVGFVKGFFQGFGW